MVAMNVVMLEVSYRFDLVLCSEKLLTFINDDKVRDSRTRRCFEVAFLYKDKFLLGSKKSSLGSSSLFNCAFSIKFNHIEVERK